MNETVKFTQDVKDKEAVYSVIVRGIKAPPREKTRWGPGKTLEIVLIEPRYPYFGKSHGRKDVTIKGTLRNFAWVYGGSDVGLTIVHGTENEAYVRQEVQRWRGLRFVNLNVSGLSYPGAFLRYIFIRRI